MDIVGDLLRTIAGSIAGLVSGALRIVVDTLSGVWIAIQTAAPGPILPLAAAAVVVLFAIRALRR